jgi:NADPH-dependent ferric siderophore reductase
MLAGTVSLVGLTAAGLEGLCLAFPSLKAIFTPEVKTALLTLSAAAAPALSRKIEMWRNPQKSGGLSPEDAVRRVIRIKHRASDAAWVQWEGSLMDAIAEGFELSQTIEGIVWNADGNQSYEMPVPPSMRADK